MVDLNTSLRKAYFAALSSIDPAVPVFYFAAPPNKKFDLYIVYRSLTNKDESTKSSSDTRTFVIVEIYSRNMSVNSGADVDDLAGKILAAIYPDRHTNITIDGGQVVNTEMTFDLVNPYNVISGEVFLSRFLTFKHIIYQSSN